LKRTLLNKAKNIFFENFDPVVLLRTYLGSRFPSGTLLTVGVEPTTSDNGSLYQPNSCALDHTTTATTKKFNKLNIIYKNIFLFKNVYPVSTNPPPRRIPVSEDRRLDPQSGISDPALEFDLKN